MLAKIYKLKKENDFKIVFEKGKFYQFNLIKLKFFKNSLDYSRFGFIVSKKFSKKATERNRIKRQLNSAVELNFSKIKNGFDIVVMISSELNNKSYQEIEDEFIKLLKKAKLINLNQ